MSVSESGRREGGVAGCFWQGVRLGSHCHLMSDSLMEDEELFFRFACEGVTQEMCRQDSVHCSMLWKLGGHSLFPNVFNVLKTWDSDCCLVLCTEYRDGALGPN